MITVNDIISKMKNGEAHVLLFNSETGAVICKTIWYNLIPHMYYSYVVDSIQVKDYEMRLGIHE